MKRVIFLVLFIACAVSAVAADKGTPRLVQNWDMTDCPPPGAFSCPAPDTFFQACCDYYDNRLYSADYKIKVTNRTIEEIEALEATIKSVLPEDAKINTVIYK